MDVGPDVGGHPLPFMEGFYCRSSQPDIQSLMQELEGDAVVMVVYLDVIVDVVPSP